MKTPWRAKKQPKMPNTKSSIHPVYKEATKKMRAFDASNMQHHYAAEKPAAMDNLIISNLLEGVSNVKRLREVLVKTRYRKEWS